MVSNNDSLVRIGTIDDANDIMNWFNRIARNSAEIQLHTRGRTRAVIDLESTCPSSAVYLLCRNAMAVESLQQRLSSRVGNRKGWDLGNDLRDISSG